MLQCVQTRISDLSAFIQSPDHILIMPRDTSIKQVSDLTKQHLPLLERFQEQAEIEIARMQKLDPLRLQLFMVGFHVIPSLYPLHLHVLDWSLSTTKMYAPRHWKVPFSNMVVSLDEVIREVRATGRFTVDEKAFRNEYRIKPIHCPVCLGPQPTWEHNIKDLELHWKTHVQSWKDGSKDLPHSRNHLNIWMPTYHVILTTRKRTSGLGLTNQLDHLKLQYPGLEIHSYFMDEWPPNTQIHTGQSHYLSLCARIAAQHCVFAQT
jgi:hypothetical protein